MTMCKKIGLAAGLVLASSASMAVIPASGWYAGLMVGGSYAPSTNFNIPDPFVAYFPAYASIPAKLSYNILANGGLQVGFRCENFRVEGELNFNSNSYDRLRIGYYTIGSSHNVQGLNLSGHTSLYSGFINGFYDFFNEENTDTTWVPYLGLGVGYARVQSTVDFFYQNTQLNFLTFKSNNNAPIGQAIAGLSYFLNDEWSMSGDVRYMSTRNIRQLDSRFSLVTLNFLVNYAFDTV